MCIFLKKIYLVDIIVGTNLGQAGVIHDAVNVPDRFELIYGGQVVADSKYVGDGLSGTPPSYGGLIGTHTLSVFSYNGTAFVDTGTTQTITVGQADIANGTTESTDGNGTLLFNKITALPTTMTLRVTGAVGGTAWNIQGVCPTPTPPNS